MNKCPVNKFGWVYDSAFGPCIVIAHKGACLDVVKIIGETSFVGSYGKGYATICSFEHKRIRKCTSEDYESVNTAEVIKTLLLRSPT